MRIAEDIKEIAVIPTDLVNEFASICLEVDWNLSEFGRKEISLVEGRLCMIPCLISRPEQLVETHERNLLWIGVDSIVKFVQQLFPQFKLVRGEIVNLLPGKSLTPHIDIHWFHKESKRIHVPILTNPDSFLTFEDRPYQLQTGKVYEINNRITHSGFNYGASDRVHVIIDMMPVDTFSHAVTNKQDFMEKI